MILNIFSHHLWIVQIISKPQTFNCTPRLNNNNRSQAISLKNAKWNAKTLTHICLVSNFGCLRNVSFCLWTKIEKSYLCRVTLPLSLHYEYSKWWLLRNIFFINHLRNESAVDQQFHHHAIQLQFIFFVHLDHQIVERWFSTFFLLAAHTHGALLAFFIQLKKATVRFQFIFIFSRKRMTWQVVVMKLIEIFFSFRLN